MASVKTKLKQIGKSKNINSKNLATGTKITFLPSNKTFQNIEFNFKQLKID